MKNRISITPDMVDTANDITTTVDDDIATTVDDVCEAERHGRAVEKYREERRAVEGVADTPWWIDVGGEGEPC